MGDGTEKLYFENDDLARCLGSLPILKDADAEIIQAISPLTKSRSFAKGTVILHEGDRNTTLFLLVDGEIEVVVDGISIAKMRRRGDIFGEMSIVSKKTVSATIKARTDVEALCIDMEGLRARADNEIKLQVILYRVFSIILSEKLNSTNQKAKQFEEMARELQKMQDALSSANEMLEQKVEHRTRELRFKADELENRNTALLTSNRKFEDLFDSNERTLKQIEDMRSSSFRDLKILFEKALRSTQSELPFILKAASLEIDKMNSVLEPISTIYRTEKAIKSKKVLLAESDGKKQIVAQMALGGTGVQIDVVSDLESAIQYLTRETYDIVIASPQFLDIVHFARDKNDKTQTVFMTSEEPSTYIHHLRQWPHLSNIVATTDQYSIFTVKNIMTTISKLVTRDIFGLEKYLNWGVDVQKSMVTGSVQRRDLIEDMASYFRNMGAGGDIVRKCTSVAEELLMNAIYDAPVDDRGRALYNSLARTVEVSLRPDQQATFRYACDGMLAAVSVEDPFGMLERSIILDYLERCFQQKQEKTYDGKAGGGLGVFIVLNMADLIVYNVKPKIRTEVIALFNVRKITQERVMNTSLHYFCDG